MSIPVACQLTILYVISSGLFAQSPFSSYCSALRLAPASQRRLVVSDGRRTKVACSRGAATGNASASLQIVEARMFVHSGGKLVGEFDSNAPEFSSGLLSDNYGTLSFTYTNKSLVSQFGVKLLAFVDLDIDATKNGFSNEYGALVSLTPPPSAPGGSVAASSWEIDEPGFVFGNIYQHLTAGALDNSNAVGLGGSDDVSVALGFQVDEVKGNEKITLTVVLSATDIGGLLQVDPVSQKKVWVNGYVRSGGVSASPGGGDDCIPCTLNNLFRAPGLLRR